MYILTCAGVVSLDIPCDICIVIFNPFKCGVASFKASENIYLFSCHLRKLLH